MNDIGCHEDIDWYFLCIASENDIRKVFVSYYVMDIQHLK